MEIEVEQRREGADKKVVERGSLENKLSQREKEIGTRKVSGVGNRRTFKGGGGGGRTTITSA